MEKASAAAAVEKTPAPSMKAAKKDASKKEAGKKEMKKAATAQRETSTSRGEEAATLSPIYRRSEGKSSRSVAASSYAGVVWRLAPAETKRAVYPPVVAAPVWPVVGDHRRNW